MPNYNYKCQKCGVVFTVMHGMNEEHTEHCHACDCDMVKLICPVPSVWHTTGNYGKDNDKV